MNSAGQTVDSLLKRLSDGNVAALSRAISLVEQGTEDGTQLHSATEGHRRDICVIGVTGPAGCGKSSLVNALIRELRSAGTLVAVLAVDPSSPKSGGAVLGDRVRMGEHAVDSGVFIRSLSSRGEHGAMAACVPKLIDLLAFSGWPCVLVETVGAGQSDTAVADIADLCIVVSAPGMGDEVQSIKAGILEIGDVLVVNKSDHPESDLLVRQLKAMLRLRSAESGEVPVIATNALNTVGVDKLADIIKDRLSGARSDTKIGRLNSWE